MMYKEVDTLESYQIEVGDLIMNPHGQVVEVIKIKEYINSIEVFYLDDYLDEDSFVIVDDESVSLYVYDPD